MGLLGDRIKELREKNKMTQEDLAQVISSTKQTIHKYEKGIVKNIPSTKLEEIAEALKTTPAYLMGWTDDPLDYESLIDVPDEYAKLGMDAEAYYKKAEEEDAIRETGKHQQEEMTNTEKIKNPDIRMIARAGTKMTDEQAELLRKYAEFTFPDAFKDINNGEE